MDDIVEIVADVISKMRNEILYDIIDGEPRNGRHHSAEEIAKTAIAAIADGELSNDAVEAATKAQNDFIYDNGLQGAMYCAIKAYLTALKEATCRT